MMGAVMSEPRLLDAMMVGSRSPTESREPTDVGRYGLGLKTASISQARSLPVATCRAGEKLASVRRWDLDHLVATGDWQLLRVSLDQGVPGVEDLRRLKHGTLVVWEKLDRLVGAAGVDDLRARGQFLGSLVSLEQHLAMVFHRFMSGRNHITIWLNGRSVELWDPFLVDDPATRRLASETLGHPDAPIAVTPYVLPHHSRLSTEEHRVAGGLECPAGFLDIPQSQAYPAGGLVGVGVPEGGALQACTHPSGPAQFVRSRMGHRRPEVPGQTAAVNAG